MSISDRTKIALLAAFPGSYFKTSQFHDGEVALVEFIAHEKANAYINLTHCKNLNDVKAKVLEGFSRDAYKTEPYRSKVANEKFHKFMRIGINVFLCTNFSSDDMEIIYTHLGNGVSHKKTMAFIRSGMRVRSFDWGKEYKNGRKQSNG